MKALGLFLGVNFVLAILITKINPFLFQKKLLLSEASHLIWKTEVFEPRHAAPGGVTFYRQDLQRTGVFLLDFAPVKAVRLWTTGPINVGIHSASKASPVADEEAIFVGSDSGWFYCFGLDGTLRWKFLAGEAYQGIHSTAALDHDSVYVGTYRGTLYRLDKKSGRLLWAKTVGQAIGASPLIDGEFITVPVETLSKNGYVVKLRRADGELVWRSFYLQEQSHSSVALSPDRKLLLLGANNNIFFGISNLTGAYVWHTVLDGKVKSTPVVVGKDVLITTWGATLYDLDLATGKLRWKAKLGEKSQVSPSFLAKEKLVVSSDVSGNLFLHDFLSGKLLKEVPLAADRNLSSPIVLATPKGNRILAACGAQDLCLLTSSGKTEWRIKLNGRMTSSPFVKGNRLYVSLNEGGLEAFELR